MTSKHKRIIGDTLLPMNAVIMRNGEPVDLSSYTVKFEQEEDGGTVITTATATGITIHPSQVFTASASTDLLTCNSHGVKEGDQIVVANSGGALPAGLSALTRYSACEVTPNAFALEAVKGMGKINLTDAGTGTHTFYVVGSVQYDFPAAAVDEVGLFRGWFTIVTGSEVHTFPDNEYGIPIEILPKGT